MFFDTKRWLHDPVYAIKVTWVTTIVVASISIVFYVAAKAWPDVLGKFAPGLLDVAIVVGLGYGVYRRSRVCAVLLVGFWVFAKLVQMYQLHTGPRAEAILIGYIFIMGARATFRIHATDGGSDADRYKPPTAAT